MSDTRPTHNRGAGFRRAAWIGLIVGMMLVSGMLVEGLLRVYSGIADTQLARQLQEDPTAIKIEPHGDHGYRPRPNVVFDYGNGTEAHINALGFRGPVVEMPKPHGAYRVVVLGGSTAFGWGVNDAETIDEYLRQLTGAEVVSLAFDGYDSWQDFQRFRSDGLALEPDLVIVHSGINDGRNARFPNLVPADPRTLLYENALRVSLRPRTLRALAKRHVYLARLPGAVRGTLGPQASQRAEIPTNWQALDYFETNMRRIADLADSVDARVAFSTPPSFLHDGWPRRSYWLQDARVTQEFRDSLSARLDHLARELGTVHVRHSLAGDMFLDDAHLTPEGNHAVALRLESILPSP